MRETRHDDHGGHDDQQEYDEWELPGQADNYWCCESQHDDQNPDGPRSRIPGSEHV
jgi:hypothetical protein